MLGLNCIYNASPGTVVVNDIIFILLNVKFDKDQYRYGTDKAYVNLFFFLKGLSFAK